VNNKIALYIVNFLLPIPCWFIMGPCLVCIDKLENDRGTKIGFTWHYWTLPDKLLCEIVKLLKDNKLN
jgi:hypothetical protein